MRGGARLLSPGQRPRRDRGRRGRPWARPVRSHRCSYAAGQKRADYVRMCVGSPARYRSVRGTPAEARLGRAGTGPAAALLSPVLGLARLPLPTLPAPPLPPPPLSLR